MLIGNGGNVLAIYREKWREVPGGNDADGRLFSDTVLGLPDDQLMAFWRVQAASRSSGVMSFLEPLYGHYFAGKRVLEIGPGLGIDGMHMIQCGAQWTFADIVPSNLDLIRRVAALSGAKADFHLIGDDLSFDGLGEFDAIYACGSIHHVPFDLAQRECANMLEHLKIGGRWIELSYPKQRWVNDGQPPFERWGRNTDGERTPWIEWYDLEKLQRRLAPAKFRKVADFNFANDAFIWLDLEREADLRQPRK
jgi:SAM-dependent methyltransferase